MAVDSRNAWTVTLSLPLLVLAACGTGLAPTPSTESVVTPAPALAPLTRLTLAYGKGPDQVGDLMLPDADGPVPVVVLIHGGFWLEPFNRELMTPLAMDLSSRGFATWNIEYRRVGASGGGWPRTAEDVATGIDFLTGLATAFCELCQTLTAVDVQKDDGEYQAWNPHRVPPRVRLRPRSPRRLWLRREEPTDRTPGFKVRPSLATLAPMGAVREKPLIARYGFALGTAGL